MAQAVMRPIPTIPPGPKGSFFLGHASSLARNWSGFSTKCAREFGDIVSYRFLRVPICQVTHPDFIDYVLVRNASNFLKSRDYAAIRSILGNGLLTSEGAFWQAQRQLIQPAFRHDSIAVYADIMADSTARFLQHWKDGESRDLHHEMAELTLDIVTRSLFGSAVPPQAQGIGLQVAAVMERFLPQAALSFLLPVGSPLPKGPALIRAKWHLDRIITAIIQERRASQARSNDLLQMLLDAQDEHGARMTNEQLRDEIMTLFMAGHETTANALTWTWYLLSQNPGAEELLYAELAGVLNGRAPALARCGSIRQPGASAVAQLKISNWAATAFPRAPTYSSCSGLRNATRASSPIPNAFSRNGGVMTLFARDAFRVSRIFPSAAARAFAWAQDLR